MPVPTHAVDPLAQGYDHAQIQAPPVLLMLVASCTPESIEPVSSP